MSVKYVSKCLPGDVTTRYCYIFLLQAAANMQELCKGLKKLDFKTLGLRIYNPQGLQDLNSVDLCVLKSFKALLPVCVKCTAQNESRVVIRFVLYLSQDSHQELYTFIQSGSVLSVYCILHLVIIIVNKI